MADLTSRLPNSLPGIYETWNVSEKHPTSHRSIASGIQLSLNVYFYQGNHQTSLYFNITKPLYPGTIIFYGFQYRYNFEFERFKNRSHLNHISKDWFSFADLIVCCMMMNGPLRMDIDYYLIELAWPCQDRKTREFSDPHPHLNINTQPGQPVDSQIITGLPNGRCHQAQI